MTKKYLQIVDPIHDFITVYQQEVELIDSSIFQRLRRIRQLAGAHLVYPGAQHSRFEHSLGTMHIAGQAANVLRNKGYLDANDSENIRMAALLHDVGHGPFSHLFEEVLQKKKKNSHEDIGQRIILETEIGDIIKKSGFDKTFLAKLAFGNSKYQFMNEIISGGLSADMMDYLLRDGYFTGAEYAKVDFMRIIHSLDVHDKKLSLDKSALHSFESMMISRYQMFKAVYFHKTVRSAEVMLIQAMALADSELGLTTDDIEIYVQMTDELVISKLVSLEPKNTDLRRAKQLAIEYQERKLLKCVYEKIFTRPRMGKMNITNLQNEIAKISKVDESEVFIDVSKTPSIPLAPSKKESQSIILTTKKGKGPKESYELPISEIPLVSAISGFMDILRVYTRKQFRKKVEMAAAVILGENNQ
ncbi:MAG: HD domain-containing protein [Thaumarchaeota archaeon]|nr:HD domain-containing protein [Nitrososphaerota archaeon]MDE1831169.1 HD domain-containing protein [Nitrososphaerota archaeon]MDE1841402.1 HD domain-containing protein [Nitrososphaerota archaeon]MDE1878011.1 HD domain-containing protein [Nitrososphaerota archaeon]